MPRFVFPRSGNETRCTTRRNKLPFARNRSEGGPGYKRGAHQLPLEFEMTELVAVLSRSLSQRDDLKEIMLFCASGLLLSLVLIHYGVDLGATP